MDYGKIHDNLISMCKTTTPKDRLIRRNPNDIRLKTDYIYSEKHHIIPRHENGQDTNENLVELLPEEHYLIHLLRFKAFGNRKDFLAVRFIVNGFISKSTIDHGTFLNKLGNHKQFIAEFRKEHGWQSTSGRQRIAEARTGMMPAKDALTGIHVGAVSTTDPRVISGELVHISKGLISCVNELGEHEYVSTAERKARNLKPNSSPQNGSNNANYRKFTDEHKQRIFDIFMDCVEDNHFKVKSLGLKLKDIFPEFKRISLVWIFNNLGSPQDLVDAYNAYANTDIQYNKYFRFTSQKLAASKLRSKQMTEHWKRQRESNDQN